VRKTPLKFEGRVFRSFWHSMQDQLAASTQDVRHHDLLVQAHIRNAETLRHAD
jgi:hypothetical protein